MSFVYCLEHHENPNWVTLLTISNKESLDERQPGYRKPRVTFEPENYIAKVQVKNASKIKGLIGTVMQPLSIVCENDSCTESQEVFSKNIRIIHAAFTLANRNTCVFSEENNIVPKQAIHPKSGKRYKSLFMSTQSTNVDLHHRLPRGRWTEDEVNDLVNLYQQGQNFQFIARELGRSIAAVKSKYYKVNKELV